MGKVVPMPQPGLPAERRKRRGLWPLVVVLLAVAGLIGALRVPSLAGPLAPVARLLSQIPGAAALLPKGATASGAEVQAPAVDELASRQEALRKAEDVVKLKEEALRQQEADLKHQADELDVRLKDVQQQSLRLQAAAAVPRVADIYRAMQPAAAAKTLGAMTDAEALAILRQLDAAMAAQILSKLPPDRAARLISGLPLPPAPAPGA